MSADRPLSLQPVLEVVGVDDLSPADRSAIIRLCADAFEEDFTPLFQYLPDSTHVLARLDGELVSHACWVTRSLQPGELRPLRTAYVEAVATAPPHQGRGYGSAVMRRLAAAIGDYELGGLSTGRFSFYERLGWERWPGPLAIRTQHGLLHTPGERVLILRLPRTPPLDLHALLTAEWRPGELW